MKRYFKVAIYTTLFITLFGACSGVERDTGSEKFVFEEGWRYDTDIQPGAAVMEEYLPLLEGKRVCLLSNQTGIILKDNTVRNRWLAVAYSDSVEYVHIVDTLLAEGVDIVCLMSPEHGFRGTADAGEEVASGVDPQTGIPIRSLYGTNMSDEEMLSGFDVLLFDLQDVGARYYTYYITMVKMMAKCARHNIPFIVLDRPNPVGFYVDGAILDMRYKSGVGGLPIPTMHGMTIGELAFMANEKGWLEFRGKEWEPDTTLKCDLTVIKCKGYTHDSHYKLPVKPSPNLPNMRSVYLYPSVCYFEATPVSVGRGTDSPFQIYGAPEMEGSKCLLPWGGEHDFCFTPQSVPGAKSPHRMGLQCYGVDLRERPSLSEINSAKINMAYVVDAYAGCGAPGESFFGNSFEKETGSADVRQIIIEEVAHAAGEEVDATEIAQKISQSWENDVEKFKVERAPYLLYD